MEYIAGNKSLSLYLCTAYLYGYASTQEYRSTVPQIRKGEYDGLPEKVYLDFITHFICG